MNDKVFIICVEINKQSLRTKFESTVIGKGNPKLIMENVYAVITPYSFNSEQVRNHVNAIFMDNCNVFVMKASIDASWRLDISTDNWLRSNI